MSLRQLASLSQIKSQEGVDVLVILKEGWLFSVKEASKPNRPYILFAAMIVLTNCMWKLHL